MKHKSLTTFPSIIICIMFIWVLFSPTLYSFNLVVSADSTNIIESKIQSNASYSCSEDDLIDYHIKQIRSNGYGFVNSSTSTELRELIANMDNDTEALNYKSLKALSDIMGGSYSVGSDMFQQDLAVQSIFAEILCNPTIFSKMGDAFFEAANQKANDLLNAISMCQSLDDIDSIKDSLGGTSDTYNLKSELQKILAMSDYTSSEFLNARNVWISKASTYVDDANIFKKLFSELDLIGYGIELGDLAINNLNELYTYCQLTAGYNALDDYMRETLDCYIKVLYQKEYMYEYGGKSSWYSVRANAVNKSFVNYFNKIVNTSNDRYISFIAEMLAEDCKTISTRAGAIIFEKVIIELIIAEACPELYAILKGAKIALDVGLLVWDKIDNISDRTLAREMCYNYMVFQDTIYTAMRNETMQDSFAYRLVNKHDNDSLILYKHGFELYKAIYKNTLMYGKQYYEYLPANVFGPFAKVLELEAEKVDEMTCHDTIIKIQDTDSSKVDSVFLVNIKDKIRNETYSMNNGYYFTFKSVVPQFECSESKYKIRLKNLNSFFIDKQNSAASMHDVSKYTPVDYSTIEDELKNNPTKDTYFSQKYDIVQLTDTYCSLKMYYHNYGGGPHGDGWTNAYLIDFITGNILTLNDIVSSTDDFKSFLANYFYDEYKTKYSKLSGWNTQNLYKYINVDDNANWYIKDNSFYVVYGIYQLGSAYSDGQQILSIPLDKCKEYFNQQAKDLFFIYSSNNIYCEHNLIKNECTICNSINYSLKYKQIELGIDNSAAITEDDSLYMWGYNYFGQLGNGTTKDSLIPIKIMDNVKSVSLGISYSAAITKDKSLYMWGHNSNGQLGNGTTKDSFVPIKIMDNVKSISLGNGHSAAITEDGSLYMWGNNNYGRLGNGTTKDSSVPIKIMDNVKSVSLGISYSAAITEDESLYMWGSNSSGQFGNGTTKDSFVPIKIMDNVKSISLNWFNSAIIMEDGNLYICGSNSNGELGNGTTKDSSVPIKIMDNVKSVSLGEDHSAAITEDDGLYIWGYNFYKQLGNDTTERSLTPTKMMDNVKSVSLGSRHSAAITEDGSLYMWGCGFYGQLGNGTTKSSYIPIKIEIPPSDNSTCVGDANGDGIIGVADLVALQSFLLVKSENISVNADINQDKVIDVFDLCLLKKCFYKR